MFVMHYPDFQSLLVHVILFFLILLLFYLHNPVVLVGSALFYTCRKKKLANDVEKVII